MKICCFSDCKNKRLKSSSFCRQHTEAVRANPSLLEFYNHKPARKTMPKKIEKKQKPLPPVLPPVRTGEDMQKKIKDLQKGFVELAADVGALKDKAAKLEKQLKDTETTITKDIVILENKLAALEKMHEDVPKDGPAQHTP